MNSDEQQQLENLVKRWVGQLAPDQANELLKNGLESLREECIAITDEVLFLPLISISITFTEQRRALTISLNDVKAAIDFIERTECFTPPLPKRLATLPFATVGRKVDEAMPRYIDVPVTADARREIQQWHGKMMPFLLSKLAQDRLEGNTGGVPSHPPLGIKLFDHCDSDMDGDDSPWEGDDGEQVSISTDHKLTESLENESSSGDDSDDEVRNDTSDLVEAHLADIDKEEVHLVVNEPCLVDLTVSPEIKDSGPPQTKKQDTVFRSGEDPSLLDDMLKPEECAVPSGNTSSSLLNSDAKVPGSKKHSRWRPHIEARHEQSCHLQSTREAASGDAGVSIHTESSFAPVLFGITKIEDDFIGFGKCIGTVIGKVHLDYAVEFHSNPAAAQAGEKRKRAPGPDIKYYTPAQVQQKILCPVNRDAEDAQIQTMSPRSSCMVPDGLLQTALDPQDAAAGSLHQLVQRLQAEKISLASSLESTKAEYEKNLRELEELRQQAARLSEEVKALKKAKAEEEEVDAGPDFKKRGHHDHSDEKKTQRKSMIPLSCSATKSAPKVDLFSPPMTIPFAAQVASDNTKATVKANPKKTRPLMNRGKVTPNILFGTSSAISIGVDTGKENIVPPSTKRLCYVLPKTTQPNKMQQKEEPASQLHQPSQQETAPTVL